MISDNPSVVLSFECKAVACTCSALLINCHKFIGRDVPAELGLAELWGKLLRDLRLKDWFQPHRSARDDRVAVEADDWTVECWIADGDATSDQWNQQEQKDSGHGA